VPTFLQALLRVNATSLASFVTLLSSGNNVPLLEPLKLVTSVANLTTSAWQQLSSSVNSVIDAVFPTTASGSVGINLSSMGNVAGIVAGEFDAILNNMKMSTSSAATTGDVAPTADASTAHLSAGEHPPHTLTDSGLLDAVPCYSASVISKCMLVTML
jgi:hypothetical protein